MQKERLHGKPDLRTYIPLLGLLLPLSVTSQATEKDPEIQPKHQPRSSTAEREIGSFGRSRESPRVTLVAGQM
jgi:hypothetical protein